MEVAIDGYSVAQIDSSCGIPVNWQDMRRSFWPAVGMYHRGMSFEWRGLRRQK